MRRVAHRSEPLQPPAPPSACAARLRGRRLVGGVDRTAARRADHTAPRAAASRPEAPSAPPSQSVLDMDHLRTDPSYVKIERQVQSGGETGAEFLSSSLPKYSKPRALRLRYVNYTLHYGLGAEVTT